MMRMTASQSSTATPSGLQFPSVSAPEGCPTLSQIFENLQFSGDNAHVP